MHNYSKKKNNQRFPLMNQRYMTIWCMILFLGICTISCNETTPIGSDIIGDEELLTTSVVDSFTIQSATVTADSIYSSDRTRLYLFGAVNDPVFGKVNASIFTQFLLRASNPNIGEKPIFDSLVLTFAYNNDIVFGNSVSNNSVSVHEVENVLQSSDLYYSNQEITYNPRLVGEKRNFQYEPSDSVTIATSIVDSTGVVLRDKVLPHLRIRLSDELGRRLMNQIGDVAFESDKQFQQFFKGLYIRPENTNNSIVFFDILSEQTKMTLYYTDDDGGLGTLDFSMNLSTAVINHFEHNYSKTPVAEFVNESTSASTEKAYVQAMSGLEIDLEIPSLTNEVLGNVAINKAELDIYQLEADGNALFTAPVALGLVAEDLVENTTVVLSSNSTGFRGDTLTVDGEMGVLYRIDIDLQSLQDFLDNSNSKKMTLLPSNPFTTPYRMVVGGPQHPTFPMKLRLIYTVIEE